MENVINRSDLRAAYLQNDQQPGSEDVEVTGKWGCEATRARSDLQFPLLSYLARGAS